MHTDFFFRYIVAINFFFKNNLQKADVEVGRGWEKQDAICMAIVGSRWASTTHETSLRMLLVF